MRVVGRAVLWSTPHGIVARRNTRQRRARKEQLAATNRSITAQAANQRGAGTIGYDTLIAAGVAAGVDERHLRAGSIPEADLEFILESITDGPGLHVGNFAGVSLAYLAARTEDLIIAVDPNVPCRGLTHPQDVVVRLLALVGASERILLVCGYSGRKNLSNQGRVMRGYDPMVEYENESAPENILDNLAAFGIRFAWALLDGNHRGDYLRSELTACASLIEPGGRVFLDDCTDSWPEIRDVFRSNSIDGWVPEATGGRVGVLRRATPP
ncbi:MAG: hypothetical protein ACHQIG_02385 [Acidimicrobiia bacterium]